MDKVQSPVGRLSFVRLHGDGDPKEKGPSKWKVTLMLPKNLEAMKTLKLTPDAKKRLLEASKAFYEMTKTECKKMAEAQWKGKTQSKRWFPILDGDEKSESFDGNKNFWLIRSKTQFKPKMIDRNQNEIEDGNIDHTNGVYSGCWARTFLSPYIYRAEGNEGISFGLGTVQKIANDVPFKEVSEDSFDNSDIKDLGIEDADFEEALDSDLEDELA